MSFAQLSNMDYKDYSMQYKPREASGLKVNSGRNSNKYLENQAAAAGVPAGGHVFKPQQQLEIIEEEVKDTPAEALRRRQGIKNTS